MKKLLFVLAVGALVFGSGCASTRQFVPFADQSKRVEDPNKGRIYVVRPEFIGCAVSMRVNDGETVIGKTGGRGYLCWEREPGTTEIRSKAENTSTLSLNVEKNQVYYIYQQVRPGIFFARNKIVKTDEKEGKEFLLKCKPPIVVKK